MIILAKEFNTTAVCIPKLHYMVNLDSRLKEIKKMIDCGKYFTINQARQYGKTTVLHALHQYLQSDYYVISMDFQMFDFAKFQNAHIFSISFGRLFLKLLKKNITNIDENLKDAISEFQKDLENGNTNFTLLELFENISTICSYTDKPLILIIDEVDSATNNQVFLDFLAQLRGYYINRNIQPTFHSVILAGVYDVKNLTLQFRTDHEHKINSPWNIAADFNVDMSFSKEDILSMLREYESDYQLGMNTNELASLLYNYTSGYPFLVSRLCKLLDEDICIKKFNKNRQKTWTKDGFQEAVKLLLTEKNTLFESLTEKLLSFPELTKMLQSLLFTGKNIPYNFYESSINIATLFGFVKNQNGNLAIANRIFDTWLYNLFLSSSEMHEKDIYKISLQDKNQFIVNGNLNMRLILEKFVVHFHDLYGNCSEQFLEDEGRKYFLLYLRPIINGTGNYYIESQTRDLRRTDIIIDYNKNQYIVEMKIWHGDEYNHRGEQQLVSYLDTYHQTKGYMISFNFNKNKQIGVKEVMINDKVLIEATV